MVNYKTIIRIIGFIVVLILPLPLAYFKILDLTQTGIVIVILITLYTTVVQYIFNTIFNDSKRPINNVRSNDHSIKLNRNNLDRELKHNFEVLLLLDNWTKSSLFEQSWKDIRDKTKELKFVYYDMYRDVLVRDIGDTEATLLIDTYERLKLLNGKSTDSLESFKDNLKIKYLVGNQNLHGNFRKEVHSLIIEVEKCLVILNKENDVYIAKIKPTYGCNI